MTIVYTNLFFSSPSHLSQLHKFLLTMIELYLDRCLRKLIVIKETRPATNQRAKNRGVELLKFEDIERLGAQKNQPEVPPRVTDLCTICYTSGTTGNPKGVMLTHQNVMSGVCAVLLQLGDHKPTSKDTMISFLPLAHMLERCCENGLYMVGGSVGFYSGDIKRLSDDMKALKPTVMPAVPRLLNRMYDKVSNQSGIFFFSSSSSSVSSFASASFPFHAFYHFFFFFIIHQYIGLAIP